MIEYVISPPADKSISHRAIMFSSLTTGKTVISNFLFAQDCLSTCNVFQAMGVDIDFYRLDNKVIVKGVGKFGLKDPNTVLDAGNSGTTIRIVSGILSAQSFNSVIDGDESLRRRPMKRIIEPLKLMGANIEDTDGYPPLKIYGRRLKGTTIVSDIPSAQVKSCILLAGALAEGITYYKEPVTSRDHTERMFALFSSPLRTENGFLVVEGGGTCFVSPGEIIIPGDISSAAFWIAYGLLKGMNYDGELTLRVRDVGVNPTRMGFVDVLKRMGADISFEDVKDCAEPYADIVVKSSNLKGVCVEDKEVPKLIDEIPILSVLAAFSKGMTLIKGVGELRVKECDRIEAIITNLAGFGVRAYTIKEDEREDLIIEGKSGSNLMVPDLVRSYGDHRIAMAFGIMAVCVGGSMDLVDDVNCVKISYPEFWDELSRLEQER